MNKYRNTEVVVERYKEMYNLHGFLIIAYDFDDTIVPVGENDCSDIRDLIKELKPYAKFIVFTCRDETAYKKIKKVLSSYNLPYDKINEPLVDIGYKSPKPYFNALLDDRCGLDQVYKSLKLFLDWVKCEQSM